MFKDIHRNTYLYVYIYLLRLLEKDRILFRGFNRISILYGKKSRMARVILHFVARFVYVKVQERTAS